MPSCDGVRTSESAFHSINTIPEDDASKTYAATLLFYGTVSSFVVLGRRTCTMLAKDPGDFHAFIVGCHIQRCGPIIVPYRCLCAALKKEVRDSGLSHRRRVMQRSPSFAFSGCSICTTLEKEAHNFRMSLNRCKM